MKKRTIALMMSVVMLLGVVVGGTIAWLISKPDPVVNTFTVGNVIIDLDEKDIDFATDENKGDITTSEDRNGGEARDRGNEYHLLPGSTYVKDPTVWVNKTSEDCWVFVKVENGLKDIIVATTIEDQITANKWTALPGNDGVYYQKVTVDKTNGNKLVVFENFKLDDNADVDAYKEATIKVTAYAIQSTNVPDAATAWGYLNP